jgi:restriction system protein
MAHSFKQGQTVNSQPPPRREPPAAALQEDFFPYWQHIQQQSRRNVAAFLASQQGAVEEFPVPSVLSVPEILLQAVVTFGTDVPEGRSIAAVALPWFDIMELIQRDPDSTYQIDPRKWEELIAGAYDRQGFEVILTPQSGDRGRDVIATRSDVGSIRIFDQVKRYKPGHVVTLEEVAAMVGTIDVARNVSKGVVTTTSKFAPRIFENPEITRLMPYRLELRDREQLLSWLASLAKRDQAG